MASIEDRDNLPDLQNTRDTRGKQIERAGVEHIKVPLKISRKHNDGIDETVQAEVSMYVSIGAQFKGTHMSRLQEILMTYQSNTLSSKHLQTIIQDMITRLESSDGYIKIKFNYFMERLAPISKVRGVQAYPIAFIGRIFKDKYDFVIEVSATGTNLCPCSKEISEYGAHNQRNRVRVRFVPNKTLWWLEDMVSLIEQNFSCPIFPVLKREDEKWVTETAYENPKFVEDMVRDVSLALDKHGIEKYEVRSQADESIHQHEAVAVLKHNWDNVPE